MAISIQQRTRSLTNDVYSDWSDWFETTEAPPYNNNDLSEYRVNDEVVPINLTNVTATYIKLTDLVKADLDLQFNSKRIKSTEYADVYSKLMSTCLQLAVEEPVKYSQKKLFERQAKGYDDDLATKNAQKELYIRQTEGFDDDLRRKMLDTQMNAWAMMFSSGLLEDKPNIITNDAVTALYNIMQAKVAPSLPAISTEHEEPADDTADDSGDDTTDDTGDTTGGTTGDTSNGGSDSGNGGDYGDSGDILGGDSGNDSFGGGESDNDGDAGDTSGDNGGMGDGDGVGDGTGANGGVMA